MNLVVNRLPCVAHEMLNRSRMGRPYTYPIPQTHGGTARNALVATRNARLALMVGQNGASLSQNSMPRPLREYVQNPEYMVARQLYLHRQFNEDVLLRNPLGPGQAPPPLQTDIDLWVELRPIAEGIEVDEFADAQIRLPSLGRQPQAAVCLCCHFF